MEEKHIQKKIETDKYITLPQSPIEQTQYNQKKNIDKTHFRIEETVAFGKSTQSPNISKVEQNLNETVAFSEAEQNPMRNYSDVEKIAEGGFGIIYKATNKSTQEMVVLKQYKKNTSPRRLIQKQIEMENDHLRHFKREAKILIQLPEHPHIINVRNFFDALGALTFEMNYIPGPTLEDLILEKKISIKKILDIYRKMADALAFIHKHGIVHRDFKPSNIIIHEETSEPVLIDFGIAFILKPSFIANDPSESYLESTFHGNVYGTMSFLAPEYIQKFNEAQKTILDGRMDQFTFGVSLYYCLFDQHPFDPRGARHGDNYSDIIPPEIEYAKNIVHGQHIPVSEQKIPLHIQPLQKHLEKFFQKLLKKDPSKRFKNMEEVKKILESYYQFEL